MDVAAENAVFATGLGFFGAPHHVAEPGYERQLRY